MEMTSIVMSAILEPRRLGLKLLWWELGRGEARALYCMEVELSKHGMRRISRAVERIVAERMPYSSVKVMARGERGATYLEIRIKVRKKEIEPSGFSDVLVYSLL
ncbi:MAG: hypothetical protein C0200_00535 [Thermoproteota archaeon]|nr:MAG: hypothetical protein C0200_00535 [Candidatus Korarchaeota archaeon]